MPSLPPRPGRRDARGGRGRPRLADRSRWRNAPRARRGRPLRGPTRDARHIGGATQLAPEVWLLAEQDTGATPRTKYYLIVLPRTASLRALVRLAHQRWAIEQQYQELKDELGLDHFEGRSLPGWQRHVVLTALAYTFLQVERHASRPRLTLPRVRAIIQEVLTAHFFVTRPALPPAHARLQQVSLRI